MIVIRDIAETRKIIRKYKQKYRLIGFVPTMGALHLGHVSLIKRARKECDFLAASIFVNPAQFGPKEDFSTYPRTFKRDKELLKKQGVDLLFLPNIKIMYSKEFSTYVDESALSKVLCGKSRPEHFKGVCTVIAKLFNIVTPDIAYFGQKDYQQALIIKRLVRDLNFPIKIKVLPIIREQDGLAVSSRNSCLNPKERKHSICLYEALLLAKCLIEKGERNTSLVINRMAQAIKPESSVKIDYIEIVDTNNLKKIERIKTKVLIALAVYIGKTCLIDNITVNIKR